jgi:hypothetical protein
MSEEKYNNAPNPFMVSTGMLHDEQKYQEFMTERTGKSSQERKKEFDEMFDRTCPPVKNKYIL